MRVMVIVKATKGSEAGAMPTEKLITEMTAFNEELLKAGILLSGDGLKPSSSGARVRFSGSERTVTHGPFAETTELAAGFWMWKVDSLEQAIEWAKRCPEPMPGEEATLEIRPVMEAEDFGDEFTPEMREKEAQIFAQAAQQQ